MSTPPIEFLAHIRDEADYLASTCEETSKSGFLEDETLTRAFIRSLEVIGACAKALPDEFRKRHPTVEWNALEVIIDKLIHPCFGTDEEIVWDFAATRAPKLNEQIEEILAMEEVEGFGSDRQG